MTVAIAWIRECADGPVTVVSAEAGSWDAAKAAVVVPDGCQIIAWVNGDNS